MTIVTKAGVTTATQCPLRELLDRLGDKWCPLVIVTLANGTLRYGELRRAIGGISKRMLTRTLRRLERDGLVTRTVHPTVPPSVEYSLTPTGMSLSGAITSLREWAYANDPEVKAARAAYDVANA